MYNLIYKQQQAYKLAIETQPLSQCTITQHSTAVKAATSLLH